MAMLPTSATRLLCLLAAGCFLCADAFLAAPAASTSWLRPRRAHGGYGVRMEALGVGLGAPAVERALPLPRRAALAHARAVLALELLRGCATQAVAAEAEADDGDSVPVADEVTDRVFLDVKFQGVNAATDKKKRDSNLDAQAAGEGRIVIGLYGDAAPKTVAVFK